ncbi:MAG TPA: hypothetical protein PLH84_04670 [Candidatus Krumholzibacteria bacterium]|nr:hypothetical protein [Candidatus Krumholzibacteria bacterium]
MSLRISCQLAVVLGASLLLPSLGCAPAITVESSPGPGHDIGLQRVFVVLEASEIDEKSRYVRMLGAEFGIAEAETLTFSSVFLDEVEAAFGAAGVRCRSWTGGADPAREEIRRLAAEFQAQAVLRILGGPTGFKMIDSGTTPSFSVMQTTYSLEAVLLTLPLEPPAIWSGTIKTDLAAENWRSFAPGMADDLVDRLIGDGVIGPGRRN